MKNLVQVVNVIPVIAKSDSLTLEEREEFKLRVSEKMINSKQIICFSKHEQNVKMTYLMNICLNKQLFEIDFELIWQLEEVLQTDSDNHKTCRQQKLMLSHDRSLSIRVRNTDSYFALASE